MLDSQGNLNLTIDIKVEGEMATLKETVNSVSSASFARTSQPSADFALFPTLQMVAQLTTFAREVTRVALEGLSVHFALSETISDLNSQSNPQSERTDSSVDRPSSRASKALGPISRPTSTRWLPT